MPVQSWGRLSGNESDTLKLYWRKEANALPKIDGPVLAYGLGRSYGDSCLIQQGTLIHMSELNKFRSFDAKTGILSCEAGLSIADLLNFVIPHGWFIPVTPGTKYVTLGGAIANDVHGKNHHRRGTIGSHILDLELMRSNGERLACSPTRETELFKATIGGLGLTGLILSCTIQLIPIESALIDAELIKTSGLDEFFEIDRASDQDFEYTVSWIDCMAKGKKRGRGLFIRGNHATDGNARKEYKPKNGPLFSIPMNGPSWLLNPWSIKAFNLAYYHKQWTHSKRVKQAFDPFFYPLDIIGSWNKLYGPKGLLQYQAIVPQDKVEELTQLFDKISASGQGSFLAVLKRFGNVPSPGMLSFPAEGYTISLDFRNVGGASRSLFDELDKIVLKAGGKLYPAKDALMSPESFQASYPQWKEFSRFIDPKFQSMFWTRVTKNG